MNQGLDSTGIVDRLRDRRLVVIGVVTALFAVALAPMMSARAQGFSIVIPVDTVVRADEGTITPLATVNVPQEDQGQVCEVEAQSENQGSVHPGNDLLVESNGSQVVLLDVEAVPGGTVQGSGQLVLGTSVVVSLRMGPDEVFSAGIDVLIDCVPVQTTTTAPQETTTTPPPETTTTPPPETTTTPPAETTTTVDVEGSSTSSIPAETTTTVDDEVLGTEVLPFTGVPDQWTLWFAVILGLLGTLMVVGSRHVSAQD